MALASTLPLTGVSDKNFPTDENEIKTGIGYRFEGYGIVNYLTVYCFRGKIIRGKSKITDLKSC